MQMLSQKETKESALLWKGNVHFVRNKLVWFDLFVNTNLKLKIFSLYKFIFRLITYYMWISV